MNDLEKELLQTFKNFAKQYEEDKRLQAEQTAKLSQTNIHLVRQCKQT